MILICFRIICATVERHYIKYSHTLHRHRSSKIWRPLKVVQSASDLYIFTSKCASRYSGVPFFHIWTSKSGPYVQFFDIATSKSGPNMQCFVHFDLKMCFSLQRCAIFPHRNFKKWSEPVSFLTFWLWNVLLATAACNFSTSQLQKVVRACGVLYILTWKCASRHSGVQFFLSALSSDLRTRRFTEVTFRPSPPTNHWKNTAFRDFPNISRLWIFFLLTFAQLYLLSSSDSTSLLCFFIFWLCYSALLFQLSILSEVRLLNFLWLASNSSKSPLVSLQMSQRLDTKHMSQNASRMHRPPFVVAVSPSRPVRWLSCTNFACPKLVHPSSAVPDDG